MEYLSQPFKLNNSGLESTITISLRLVFMKVWDIESKLAEEKSSFENSADPVNNIKYSFYFYLTAV